MDPELLRLLIDMWRARQTSGDASIGGLPAYDDYNISSRIGEPDGAPVSPDQFAYPDMTFNDHYTHDGSGSGVVNVGGTLTIAKILDQMQQGVGNGPAYPQMSGLFGSTPVIERPKPQTVTPVAAPVAGQLNAPASGTPTPNPRTDIKTLPRKPKEKSVRRPIYNAPQVAQQIAQRAIASMQPQQQRTFTSAPAPRATAQAHALPISRPNSSLGAALAKLKR